MAKRFVPWGNDAHGFVCNFLPWHSNAKLACCSRAFRDAWIGFASTNDVVWWGQAQSTSFDVETLILSLERARKGLTPPSRPNMVMFMIDSQVLWTTTVRDICKRLHSANLVPLECPIFVVESDSGVFGAGVSGEWNFTVYEGRDIELNPPAPVTAVLTVAYIPPELEPDDGGGATPRVSCFLVNDQPMNRRYEFHRPVIEGVGAVFMERAPPSSITRTVRGGATGGSSAKVPAASTLSRGESAAPAFALPNPTTTRRRSGSSSTDQTGVGDKESRDPVGSICRKSGQEGPTHNEMVGEVGAKPLRRSTRTLTVASSRAASQRAQYDLLPPSSDAPLEGADTILLVGSHPTVLANTAAWLKKLLPQAVVLGGVSGCTLVLGDRVFPSDLHRQRRSVVRVPQLVGIALRGVQAMAVSSKGFEGLGPVFRVDSAAQSSEEVPQGQPGKFLRDVVVVAEVNGVTSSRPSTAVEVLHNEVLHGPAWTASGFDEVYLGVSSSPADLLNPRSASEGGGDAAGAGNARGTPPIAVLSDVEHALSLDEEVSPGQFARFMRPTPGLSLADTAATYHFCKQRLDRQGGAVLSSIRFACSLRPERVEVSVEQPQQQYQPEGRQHPAQDADVLGNCIMALHQQETVQFCRTLKAPSAGVFCNGELGPLPTLVRGIFPRTAGVRLQSFTACSAVLCWSP